MKRVFLFFASITFALVARAQSEEPVVITAPSSAISIARGKAGTVRLALKIEDPWHIYSPVAQIGPRGSGPEPTAVSVKANKGVRREGALATSKLKRYLDPNFDMEVGVLEGSAWLDVPLAADGAAKAGTYDVELVVSFQACDDQTCLPPQEVTVRVKIAIVP